MTIPARVGRVLDNVVAPTSLAGVADLATWTVVGGPIMLMRVGVLVTVATTGAVPTVRYDVRTMYGTDVGRYNGLIGWLTFPGDALPMGTVVWHETRAGIAPGNQVVCVVETPAGSGSGIPFIEYEARPDNPANLPGVTHAMHGTGIRYTGPRPAVGGPGDAVQGQGFGTLTQRVADPVLVPPAPPAPQWVLGGENDPDEPAWVHEALRRQIWLAQQSR